MRAKSGHGQRRRPPGTAEVPEHWVRAQGNRRSADAPEHQEWLEASLDLPDRWTKAPDPVRTKPAGHADWLDEPDLPGPDLG